MKKALAKHLQKTNMSLYSVASQPLYFIRSSMGFFWQTLIFPYTITGAQDIPSNSHKHQDSS
uniref:Uncharacterized protein n=1 Tax=Anguilla anguilla TaxID=7936 RepID=A0A0E9W6T3_ANGAN